MPIDLAKNRYIVFNSNGRPYTLVLTPIGKAAWLKYFAGIESTSENINGNRIESFDSSGARLQLVTDALVDAQGYRTGSGGAVQDLPGWRDLIPTSHRLAAGNVLISVSRSDVADTEAMLLGFEVVSLDALWSAAEDGSGMVRFSGLKHAFGTPTIEQQQRYNRDVSRSKIVGGSRTGKTRWMGAQPTLVALYDELITAVDGYSVNGVPLDFANPDHDAIVRNMDTFHKVAAAESLFAPAQPELKEAE